jgi:hypothetical protein
LDRVWGLALINYLQDLQKYNLWYNLMLHSTYFD